MNLRNLFLMIGILALAAAAIGGRLQGWAQSNSVDSMAAGREQVVFWHFWGGRDREVVDDVVARFNDSQSKYFVRAIVMPGNNLQAKLFLSVTGGDPPDLVNQDDPILADWASRGVIRSIDSVASADEVHELNAWMYESAARLSKVDGRFYGVCNGLDIRALYYNQTLLEQHGLSPPKTIDELDSIAESISPFGEDSDRDYYAYLPDSRRLWAWGYVFGGRFYDTENYRVIADSDKIVSALKWQQNYSRRYGADNLAAFRKGDQSLPGKTFPLLPVSTESMVGRYGLIMDGQWRTRDIAEFIEHRKTLGIESPEFGVCPLPAPTGGRMTSGWVNGNFFVMPAGSKNPKGAWEFVKFWIGFDDPTQAARTCAAGGWIPVSKAVADSAEFQGFLESNPLFEKFVKFAASPNQFPTPMIPGAAMFKRTVESAAYEAMAKPESDPGSILQDATKRIQQHLDRSRRGK